MDRLTIRRRRPAEAAALVHLPYYDIRSWYTTLVACRADQVLGYLQHCGGCIAVVGVAEDAQGRGVGRALVAHLQARYPYLAARGVVDGAVGFWRRVGFAYAGDLDSRTTDEREACYLWPAALAEEPHPLRKVILAATLDPTPRRPKQKEVR